MFYKSCNICHKLPYTITYHCIWYLSYYKLVLFTSSLSFFKYYFAS